MPARLKPGVREDRRRSLAPLCQWMGSRGIAWSRVVMLAFQQHEGRAITESHASQIRRGKAPAPEWLIEECCSVLCIPVSLIYPDPANPADPVASAVPTGHAGALGEPEWSVA